MGEFAPVQDQFETVYSRATEDLHKLDVLQPLPSIDAFKIKLNAIAPVYEVLGEFSESPPRLLIMPPFEKRLFRKIGSVLQAEVTGPLADAMDTNETWSLTVTQGGGADDLLAPNLVPKHLPYSAFRDIRSTEYLTLLWQYPEERKVAGAVNTKVSSGMYSHFFAKELDDSIRIDMQQGQIMSALFGDKSPGHRRLTMDVHNLPLTEG